MVLAAVLTTKIVVESNDKLPEVHRFMAGHGCATESQYAAMQRHACAITVRNASALNNEILACVLIIEPVAKGVSLIHGPVLQPNFFILGDVCVSPRLASFRAELQQSLIAAAVTLIEVMLGNRDDRAPGAIVLVQEADLTGGDLLRRLSARPLGLVGELVTRVHQELGLGSARIPNGWLIRSASLPSAAALTLSTGANSRLPPRRRNAFTEHLEILCVRNELPWSRHLRPEVEDLAKGVIERDWQASPAAGAFLPLARASDERRG